MSVATRRRPGPTSHSRCAVSAGTRRCHSERDAATPSARCRTRWRASCTAPSAASTASTRSSWARIATSRPSPATPRCRGSALRPWPQAVRRRRLSRESTTSHRMRAVRQPGGRRGRAAGCGPRPDPRPRRRRAAPRSPGRPWAAPARARRERAAGPSRVVAGSRPRRLRFPPGGCRGAVGRRGPRSFRRGRRCGTARRRTPGPGPEPRRPGRRAVAVVRGHEHGQVVGARSEGPPAQHAGDPVPGGVLLDVREAGGLVGCTDRVDTALHARVDRRRARCRGRARCPRPRRRARATGARPGSTGRGSAPACSATAGRGRRARRTGSGRSRGRARRARGSGARSRLAVARARRPGR